MNKSNILLWVSTLILFCDGRSIKPYNNCGYKSCHAIKEGYVNVHLIPHSHDDVGWIKTVDEFFYGTKSYLYRAAVVNIYDNVLKSVQKSRDRRFIYVETAFFWKWWLQQSERERDELRTLVNNGQIEFIGGGWSMNDEAVTNYQSVIDQMTWGLRKLNDTFGECGRPKMGWQIDPFGHSNEMASTFAQLGYDGVILGRIDFEDKATRLANRTMDLIWRGSSSLGRETDIFTSVLYNHYDAPAGFCFDVLCDDDPLVDDIDSPEYNIAEKAKDFISNHVRRASPNFQTNNVIVPMGRDFAYQESEAWFQSIDKLIKYINNKEIFNNTKYNLIYSTPSCYAAAVQKVSKGILSAPLKTDDFFPYSSEAGAYWTGYYTSRPTLKRYERMGNNFLQICKQLYSLTNLSPEHEPKLNSLREAMGVMQHHDAITGTEQEHVAHDYARLLDIGINNCEHITNKALSHLTGATDTKFETCLMVNVSQCAFSETHDRFVVTVYNPLSSFVNKYVRLPVFGTSYSIVDPDGKNVQNQIMPIARGVQKIIGRKSNATLELVFEAKVIPPLGFKSFFIQRQEQNDETAEDLDLLFDFYNKKNTGFSIDPTTGLVEKVRVNKIKLDFDQRFWFYNGSNGWGEMNVRPSGAYIFKPDSTHPIAKISDTARFEIYRGEIVTEVHQWFDSTVSQVVRIYENENYIEFDWVIGPLNSENSNWPYINGQEIISRFTTPLESHSTFYTDSNGREMMKRRKNYRPSWDINVTDAISSNYYPITSKIAIRDEQKNLEFAVLTDRAEGGSSLEDGEIELMLLRNSVSDDQLGVSEPLTEMAFGEPIVVRGSHYVTLGHIETSSKTEQTAAALEHEIASKKLLDSWVFLSATPAKTFSEYKSSHIMQFSGLNVALPKNVRIMTLEPWKTARYLLRLEHIFEKGLDPILSQTATVDLQDIFVTLTIKSVRETTLGANQWLEENKRLSFKSVHQSDPLDFKTDNYLDNFRIKLKPMQIRTFIIEVEPKM